MNVDMANRLAYRRRAAGLSQEALAEKLGVTRQAVSKWERSESSPDTDNLIALANLYGVSLDDLLYAEVQNAGDNGTEYAVTDTNEQAATNGDATNADAERENAKSEDEENRAAESRNTENAENGNAESTTGNAHTSESAETNSNTARHSKKNGFHIGADGILVQDGKEHVSIGYDGIHVVDNKKGDTVHIGWNGIHVNDQHFENISDFHEKFPQYAHHKCGMKSNFVRAWMHFPFPVLAILAYILIGLATGMWLQGLFIAFTIPLYYVIGAFIETRSASTLISGLYAIGTIAWFCYMAFVMNQPHPAWVVLLTIPLVCALAAWLRHVGKKHNKKQGD